VQVEEGLAVATVVEESAAAPRQWPPPSSRRVLTLFIHEFYLSHKMEKWLKYY
jgi:hypothetical protein